MNACTELAAALDDAALGATPSIALAAHLSTCAACAAQLERRRQLAQRIGRALGDDARAEPPPGLAERVVARAALLERPRRSRAVWTIAPAGVALAAGLLIVFSAFGGLRAPVQATDVAALDAWRSPTASLLLSRTNVLGAPFTLRSGVGHSRS
jgi:anti-sigma factor RsiW